MMIDRSRVELTVLIVVCRIRYVWHDLRSSMSHPACPDIIFENDHILALNKPTGLLSVPGIGPEKADCLAARVQTTFPEARIVHRLDRDTSGVIVMARDKDTHRELSRQFQDRETQKRYIAIAAGEMVERSGEIDLPIRKDLDDTPRQIVDFEHGKASLTRWSACSEDIRQDSNFDFTFFDRDFPHTRLELRPVTGRSHQLRLHLKSIGHPILGDDLYAPPDARDAADRLMLHAEYLMVTDPYTASPLEFEVPSPF